MKRNEVLLRITLYEALKRVDATYPERDTNNTQRARHRDEVLRLLIKFELEYARLNASHGRMEGTARRDLGEGLDSDEEFCLLDFLFEEVGPDVLFGLECLPDDIHNILASAHKMLEFALLSEMDAYFVERNSLAQLFREDMNTGTGSSDFSKKLAPTPPKLDPERLRIFQILKKRNDSPSALGAKRKPGIS